MGTGYLPPQPTMGSGERCKLPQRGPGQSPGEKRFYCFLSVSEHLSLQRLLKINVVHSRPLIQKNGLAEWICSDPLMQLRRQFFAVLALTS